MTSLNVNLDMAIAGGPRPLGSPHRDQASDAFGDTLQDVLERADEAAIDTTTGRPRSNRDADPDESAAEKDSDTDKTSPIDGVIFGSNGELVRTPPAPPPADQNGTGATSRDWQEVSATADLSEALAALAQTTDDATTSAADAKPAGGVAQHAAPRNQSETRHGTTDRPRSLAEIDGEVASNLASMLQQMAGGPALGQSATIDNQLTEREWRRAMIAKLSNLIESSASDRSNSTASSRASVPQLPAAAALHQTVAAMANQATEERGSMTANTVAVSGIGELFEAERSSSFDRHALSQLNQLRLEPSVVTPLRFATDAIGTPGAPNEQRPIDTDLPEQIIQSIRVQALDLGSEARVRLRPGYLGEVVVSVKVDAGAVTATLRADTPAVRRWIETHEASLRIGLADHGLHLDRLIVSEPEKSESEPEERRRHPQQEQAAREQSRRQQRKEQDAGPFEVLV